MCSESPSNVNNYSNARLFSDLMKFTAVNESLPEQSRNVLFKRKNIAIRVKQQKDNLHKYTAFAYGEDALYRYSK